MSIGRWRTIWNIYASSASLPRARHGSYTSLSVVSLRGVSMKARQQSQHVIISRITAGLMTIALAGLLVACGLPRLGVHQGTLIGDVIAGPTCPVERTDQPCPPALVPNREVRFLDSAGAVVATTITDARGHFAVSLVPGAYVVQVAIVPGQIGMSQVTPGNVTVADGKSIYIKIELDTGIR
jgi:hypothetical protein